MFENESNKHCNRGRIKSKKWFLIFIINDEQKWLDFNTRESLSIVLNAFEKTYINFRYEILEKEF